MNSILLITKNYPPQIGGIEKYSQDLYSRFNQDGFDVYLIKTWSRKDSFLGRKFVGFYILYFLNEFFRLFFLFIQIFTIGIYYSYQSKIIWTLDGSLAPF